MNVYVSVDIEGITGVVHGDMMMAGQPEYGRGRSLMMGDANAAVEGLVRAGAELVVVGDGHGPMRNLLIEDLHPGAQLVSGSGDAKDFCQLEGADSDRFDAAVFVGYHAMAKTFKAIHPHTIAGIAVGELRINGRPHGETGLNAAVLASLGIPTVMVTGDATTVEEAKTFLGPEIETVAVKRAVGRNAAICRPPAVTRAEITAAAERALGLLGALSPYRPDEPWRLEVDFNTMPQCDRAARTAGIERTGALSIVVHGEAPWEQYRALWAGLRSALYEPASWLG
ncbi:MAG: M55 family metallopeptidase [Thermomicrobiales bacterium]